MARVCGLCGRTGHNRRTCPAPPEAQLLPKEKGERYCGVCGKQGHNSRTCLWRTGTPMPCEKCGQDVFVPEDEVLFYTLCSGCRSEESS